MYDALPGNLWIRIIPLALVAALSLWGLISPRTQWPLLWGWQRRYRVITDERDQVDTVRDGCVIPLVVSVALIVVFTFAG